MKPTVKELIIILLDFNMDEIINFKELSRYWGRLENRREKIIEGEEKKRRRNT